MPGACDFQGGDEGGWLFRSTGQLSIKTIVNQHTFAATETKFLHEKPIGKLKNQADCDLSVRETQDLIRYIEAASVYVAQCQAALDVGPRRGPITACGFYTRWAHSSVNGTPPHILPRHERARFPTRTCRPLSSVPVPFKTRPPLLDRFLLKAGSLSSLLSYLIPQSPSSITPLG